MTELVATPASGRPGDPLQICGYARRANVTVTISVGNPDSDDGWPQSDDHVAISDDDGRFCWVGVIPTRMEIALGDHAGEWYDTPPGRYVLAATSAGNTFAHGWLDIHE